MRKHPEAGFTLIEVMAALAILAIAMTAVFATFTSQHQSFTTQRRVAEMQQNLRLAADVLVRDIRLAGYGLPVTTGTSADNVALPGSMNSHGITTIRALFPVDNTAGPDQVYILYLYDMDANQPPAELTADMIATTGVAVDNTAGFVPGGGELVLVTDRVTADLFETTGGTATTLNFATASSPYNNATLHPKLYQVGVTPGSPPTVAAKARFIRYFIDNVTYPDGSVHPTLMVDRLNGDAPQPVADDIEDLQLSYWLDTNNDGVAETDKCTTAGNGTFSMGQIPQIRQVVLHLVARSRMPEKGWRDSRPKAGNRAQAATVDGYRRRTIEVKIDVRNSGT
ncbi:MAG: PilW family protein [Deltaproteobacteria bacterium]|nr:PilW family protein [Deltaproteobacteria bacterium]